MKATSDSRRRRPPTDVRSVSVVVTVDSEENTIAQVPEMVLRQPCVAKLVAANPERL